MQAAAAGAARVQPTPPQTRNPTPRRPRPALFEVSFHVTNTGERRGADVAQLYVTPAPSRLPRPKRELEAFARVELAPGETRRVSLPLDARSFAYYDPEQGRWLAEAGSYGVELARSAEDIQARATVTLAQPLAVGVED